MPWVRWGDLGPISSEASAGQPFGLQFEKSVAGIVAWAYYIKACRRGQTEVAGWGNPVVVRAWIATEEIEMVCSGFASAEELIEFMELDGLVVQYCLLEQGLVDTALAFVDAERFN